MLVKSGLATMVRNPGDPAAIAFGDVCFPPKALLIWANNSNNYAGYGPNGGEAAIQMGWTTGPSAQYSQRTRHDGGSVRFTQEDSSTIGGVILAFSLISFDAEGFTLNLPFFGTYRFFWMAFGGDDLQVAQGSLTPAAGSGSVSVTGLSFKPDFLFALHGDDGEELGSNYSFGMASAPGEQAAVSGSQWLFGSHNHTLLNGKLCIPKSAGSGDTFIARLASFNADGFTVTTDSGSASAGGVIYYLALHDPGTSFKAGVESAKTSTGQKSTTVGFKPGAGIFAGSFKLVDNDATYTGWPQFGWGVADATPTQSYSSMWSTGGGFGGSEQDGYQNIDAVVDISQVSGSFSSHTPFARASLYSWDGTGFTLDWSVADGNGYKFIYGVFSTEIDDPCQKFVPQIYRMWEY